MNENQEKALRGAKNQKTLNLIFSDYRQKGWIQNIEKIDERIEKVKNRYTCYVPFLLTLNDGTRIGVYSTTSLRTDRLKQNYWDSFLLKKYYHADKCFLVYPDGAKDTPIFTKQNNVLCEIHENYGDDINTLDEILPLSEFYSYLENLHLSTLAHGKKEALRGLSFENHICEILNHNDNLLKWIGDTLASGYLFPIYSKILSCFECPHDIISVNATTHIDKLPSGGNPKTDILVTIAFKNSSKKQFAISCKRFKGSSVTVHEYKAEDFIRILHIVNPVLQNYIYLFQKYGNMRDMGKSNVQEMTRLLEPHLDDLIKWVIAGIGGDGDPSTQWAQYIINKREDVNDIRIYTIQEYMDKLKKIRPRSFGTPFDWTYPSKKRGQRIQLKMPVF